MKRLLATVLALCILLFTLVSCKSTEEYYRNNAILVTVSHTSGLNTYSEYDIYFENIKEGQTYDLPNGDYNPYEVSLTITEIDKEKITFSFSQPMDFINSEDSNKL